MQIKEINIQQKPRLSDLIIHQEITELDKHLGSDGLRVTFKIVTVRITSSMYFELLNCFKLNVLGVKLRELRVHSIVRTE